MLKNNTEQITINNFNFTERIPKQIDKTLLYVSIVAIFLGLFSIGFISLIFTIPFLLYVYFVDLKKQEDRERKEIEEIEKENQIIRNKLKKLIRKEEAINIMLEVNDCRTLKEDMEEMKILFNELAVYPVGHFIDEDIYFKTMAKAEEKNQNYYEALRLSTIVVYQYKPTKEIKKVLANSLNKLNIDMKLEDYLYFIDNNSYTTVLNKIDELTGNNGGGI
ncbi:hypothetical protein [Fusobacterium nucleatum]|uniref:hypothetical protein n=1 Tax=Fusobacterium nucleatum TaxID=851 RepID=UPI00201A3B5A|nr:hypothetical protein [Fusobacterium nucleatum]MCL4592963.1 hypothetical protein [Fusobacterium nucleatum YWH7053]